MSRAIPSPRRHSVSHRQALAACYRPYVDRAALRSAAAVEQMAEDLRIFCAVAGAVTKDDLEVLGWTAAQIEQHASASRAHANRSADQ